ncbi:hypothetical protein D0Z07_8539 [Hyphodiscus hymeniophilus]|uniref:VWFA domain-containing protein n=1 Tax=Hyphodiscus hymeniophilus TaxID=353542 RepID=A0A9P6SQ52_9HELO|nr:hypothetical protein D0Z07_8539 [Hyphodiscus hymeniophilus]
MVPSKDDIAKFMTFAPGADEGKAFMFLEGAGTLDEAVGHFYEDPDRYSHSPDSGKSKPVDQKSVDHTTTEAKPPVYAPPPYNPPTNTLARRRPHTNAVVEAGNVRARDEQQMQNKLQSVQMSYKIYNSDIEPEHDSDYYCSCPIHQYQRLKINRLGVQEMWSKAVMYPGEKFYHDCYQIGFFSSNPYRFRVVSPFGTNTFGGNMSSYYGPPRPSPTYYSRSVQQTIQLNATLNKEAQAAIDAKEPSFNIWEMDQLDASMSNLSMASSGPSDEKKRPVEKPSASSNEKRQSIAGPSSNSAVQGRKPSKFAGLKKTLAMKTPEEKAVAKAQKQSGSSRDLRNAILQEEDGRWPDPEWRQIVAAYQEKVGMTRKIADLRVRHPTQYLHLLRAGYFEPIPVAWANLASNPLKFSIEAAAGWRGITPAWRGYEDTAEERLYWVLNHREGSVGTRLKPDFISAMNLARARMASAVEPPPVYFSPNDTCHVQHTSEGYSKQVMPPPFIAYDAPETATDDTMILLDVSGSMDFDPLRPDYNGYLITGYSRSTQPKNKDVAKAIIRRFTDAMANHDHNFKGYQLTTFANQADYIGVINHQNLESMWRNVRLGGGTRVMTGWQKVKELHFQKHSESATHHPVYGWQAGPETPILRVLLLLDGEATDMDEFELDLLGLSWVHVTIFLIGVDGCPHHHRHANELQRISEVNHHVSFVDAQGNTPERFVTHELLKRHLGYEISISEFEELETPPPYVA